MIRGHPRSAQTPIIFVTGVHLTDLDRLRGYEMGAVDYVSVPVIPEILRGKVSVLVQLYLQRLELSRLNDAMTVANAKLAAAHDAAQGGEHARAAESEPHARARRRDCSPRSPSASAGSRCCRTKRAARTIPGDPSARAPQSAIGDATARS